MGLAFGVVRPYAGTMMGLHLQLNQCRLNVTVETSHVGLQREQTAMATNAARHTHFGSVMSYR